jgi:hypothetical protein
MTYDQHKDRTAGFTQPQAVALIQSLAADERFAGVVAWLEFNRHDLVNAGCQRALAGDHGRLAHMQGSVNAMNVLINQLHQMLAPADAVTGGIPVPVPSDIRE